MTKELQKAGVVITLSLLGAMACLGAVEIKCNKIEMKAVSESDRPIVWLGGRSFWIYNKRIANGSFDYEIDLSPLKSALQVSQEEYLLSISFINASTGFCWNEEPGNSSGLMRTVDAGLTWTKIADGGISRCVPSVSRGGLYFFNRQQGFRNPEIIWINSAGEIASRIGLPKKDTLGGVIIAVDGQTLVGTFYSDDAPASGENAMIVGKTENGGKTWDTMRVKVPTKGGRLLAAGADGTLQFKENPGGIAGSKLHLKMARSGNWKRLPGENWVEVFQARGKHMFGLRKPKKRAYAFRDLELWESKDNGSSWTKIDDEKATEGFWGELFPSLEDWQNGQQWALRHLADVP